MRRLSDWLIERSKGWLVLIATLVFVLFMIFVLPDQAEKADDYAQGYGSPDTSFFYSSDELFNLAKLYGEEGRQAYIRSRFSFDLVFPAVYGLFLITMISWLLGKGIQSGSGWRLLNLMPVLGVIFDLLENISTSVVMAAYPDQRIVAAQLAPILSLAKWAFVFGSFLIIVLVFGYWIVRKSIRG